MKIFKRSMSPVDDDFGAIMNRAVGGGYITESMAMEIPTVAACVNPICDLIGNIPIRLYERKDGEIKEITDDVRLTMLNGDTGDLVNAVQMKRGMAYDYLLHGKGYTYINRDVYGQIRSLNYVTQKNVSVTYNANPIFKQALIHCGGKQYQPFDFLKITRATEKGLDGEGIIDENQRILSVAYHSLKYEENLVKSGGNKRGFLKLTRKLSEQALERLKEAITNLYSNNEKNIVVVNDGADFKEASNTVVEMQLNQNKISNANEIFKIFSVPAGMFTGRASEEDIERFMLFGINPIIKSFEMTLNIDLLNEDEKQTKFFEADTKEILKGDIQKLFNAYATAVKNNFMSYDEVREKLNLPPTGFNYVRIGLQDVIYDPKTEMLYTPNTNQWQKMGGGNIHLKGGGDKNEGRNKSGE